MQFEGANVSREALRVFVEHRRRLGDVEAERSFEQLCADHPAQSAELRVLHSQRDLLSACLAELEALGESTSVHQRLVARFGSAAEPAAALGAELGAGDGFNDELVARLATRRLGHGRYRIQEQLAAGGQGVVLRVWDEDLRRHLAMKLLTTARTASSGGPGPAPDPRQLARFLEEAQITGQLDHPGIVPIHELGLDAESNVFYTMKLLRGRRLREVIELVQRGAESWNLTRGIGVVLKVCEAMAYAHAKGAVHRDLKPDNVMVGRFGEVYVIDWGLARVLGRPDTKDVRIRPTADLGVRTVEFATDRQDGTRTTSDSPILTMDGDVLGTPAYMSPEQARGELESISPCSDVYSVGSILYHMLSGRVPFVRPDARLSARDVLALLRNGPPEPLHQIAPDAPAELVAICEKAMARETRDRYASMEELADDLHAYVDGRVVRAHRTGALAELHKWVERNRRFAAAAALAILLLVGLAATAAWLSRSLEHSRELAEELSLEDAIADRALLDGLLAHADELWPATPATVPEMEAWIAATRRLAAKADQHGAALERLRVRAAAISGVADTAARLEMEALSSFLADLPRLLDPEHGRLVELERRLAFAREVVERSVTGAEASAAWARAIESIADVDECPAYDGLALDPQLGLLPIGRDPRSGLWEFAHLFSGEVPVRGPDGELAIDARSAIVLVLLPEGSYLRGAQSADFNGDHHDLSAQPNEGPVDFVTLADPFFLAKFELSQAHWVRLAGDNPSSHLGEGDAGLSLLHPVENVCWERAVEVIARTGLQLPTETQWEYAARAGTDDPWWCGDSPSSLEGRENLADRSLQVEGSDFAVHVSWSDGYSAHAPVNQGFQPNPWGFMHMLGNVMEFCRDTYASDYASSNEVDGVAGSVEQSRKLARVVRGGAFLSGPIQARASARIPYYPTHMESCQGLRPARALDDSDTHLLISAPAEPR